MAYTVLKRCPHCGDIEQSLDQRGIGQPFFNCPECNGVIVDTDCTEWELKGPIGKLFYILICGWSSIFYGALFLLAGLVLREKFGFEISDTVLFGLWGAGAICFLVLMVFLNLKDIRESQERMKDSRYREFLKTLGLLKG